MELFVFFGFFGIAAFSVGILGSWKMVEASTHMNSCSPLELTSCINNTKSGEGRGCTKHYYLRVKCMDVGSGRGVTICVYAYIYIYVYVYSSPCTKDPISSPNNQSSFKELCPWRVSSGQLTAVSSSCMLAFRTPPGQAAAFGQRCHSRSAISTWAAFR